MKGKLRAVAWKGETVEQGTSSFESAMHVYIPGMGTTNMEPGHGPPVLVEFYDGVWKLHVWADINEEDPTHVIDLSGALESNREEENEANDKAS